MKSLYKGVNETPEINENILHAPSTNLSLLAQATKVLPPKSIDKKNPPPPSLPKLPSKPPQDTSLTEEVKELMGKGTFN